MIISAYFNGFSNQVVLKKGSFSQKPQVKTFKTYQKVSWIVIATIWCSLLVLLLYECLQLSNFNNGSLIFSWSILKQKNITQKNITLLETSMENNYRT